MLRNYLRHLDKYYGMYAFPAKARLLQIGASRSFSVL